MIRTRIVKPMLPKNQDVAEKDMPQIIRKDYPTFLDYLKKKKRKR